MPSNRAAFSRSSMAATAFADQLGSSSANPQLHESATGFAVITLVEKIDPPALIEGGKVDRDTRLGAQTGDDLHVHHNFDAVAQYLTALLRRERESLLQRIGRSIDRDRLNVWRRPLELVAVGGRVVCEIAAAEFGDHDALTGTIAGREIVALLQIRPALMAIE